MIIKQYQKEDEIIHGNVESVDCTIKTDDAKLFYVLSNLYSRPLNAVVRELSTNCLDGHRVVGKEKVPFEIRISNSILDDEFNIAFRDFGPGMSKATIVKVFSTFGESTKINSNLETGCLGLGSKSPFSITSTFMVTSYIDNIKYIYNMSKDATGRPKITLFNEVYTDEPNGMEITVPLDSNAFDVSKLKDAINIELFFFRTKPNIYINSVKYDFEKEKDNYIKMSHMCYFVKEYNTNNSNIVKNIAIQGEIGYPLDIDKLLKTCSTNNTLKLFETNFRQELNADTKLLIKEIYTFYSFHTFCKIGELSFAPSREELIYDPITITNLLKYIINNIKSIMSRFHQMMEIMTTSELVALAYSNKLEFRIPVRQEVYKRFFGIGLEQRMDKIRELYVNGLQSYFGIVYDEEEQAQLLLTNGVYLKRSSSGNLEANISLNKYGKFNTSYYKDSLDDEKNFPVRFGETLELLKVEKNYSKFISLVTLKGMKINYNDTNVVLKNLGANGLLLVDVSLTTLKSYKAKIDTYMKGHPEIETCFILRYTNHTRKNDIIYRFFNRYGVDVAKDFINIDVADLEEYAAAQAKLKRENAKQLIIKDETGKDRVVRVKDEIPYYQVGKLSSFTNIKSVGNIFKSYNTCTLTVDLDDLICRNQIKNMLYIPLDNKNKSITYINNYINNVVSKSLFTDKSVADNSVLHSQLTIFQALDYVSYIKYYKGPKENLRSNSRKYKSPFSGKIIVCMNEAKAKKIGMRSFKEYFERTFLKLMDFSKLDDMTLINTNTDYSSQVRYIRFHEVMKQFNIIPNLADLSLVKCNMSGSDIPVIKERYNFSQEIISTRFANIESKFHKCDFTTEMFEMFRSVDMITTDSKYKLLPPSFVSAAEIIKIIKFYNHDLKIKSANTADIGSKYEFIMDTIVRLSKYIYDGAMSSWTLDLGSNHKITEFRNRIDQYLLEINIDIITLTSDNTKTFMDPEIIVQDEDNSEKEYDATDVA